MSSEVQYFIPGRRPERINPKVGFTSESWTEKPAFGTALEEHLKRSNRDIALPIEACVMMLLETGMKEEVWTKKKKQ